MGLTCTYRKTKTFLLRVAVTLTWHRWHYWHKIHTVDWQYKLSTCHVLYL